MDNEWIEWKGGECPVDNNYGFIMVRMRSGVEAMIKSSVADWVHRGSEYDVIAYQFDQQDPYKEWVRIQEGCPMPAEGVEVVAKGVSGDFYYCYIDDENDGRDFGVFNTDYGFDIIATHWRCPHPDPEV